MLFGKTASTKSLAKQQTSNVFINTTHVGLKMGLCSNGSELTTSIKVTGTKTWVLRCSQTIGRAHTKGRTFTECFMHGSTTYTPVSPQRWALV